MELRWWSFVILDELTQEVSQDTLTHTGKEMQYIAISDVSSSLLWSSDEIIGNVSSSSHVRHVLRQKRRDEGLCLWILDSLETQESFPFFERSIRFLLGSSLQSFYVFFFSCPSLFVSLSLRVSCLPVSFLSSVFTRVFFPFFFFWVFFQDFWEKAFHRELCVLRKRKGIRRIQDQKEIESEEEESTKRGFSSLKEIRKLDSSFHPLRFDLVSWSSLKNFVVFMLLSSSYVWYWCAVLRDTLSVGGLLGIKWQFESYKGFGDASFHWILCFFLLLDSKGLDKDWRHWFSWLSIRVEDTGTILSLLLLVRVLLSWLKLLRDEKL